MMNEYHFNAQTLKDQIETLPRSHRVVFATSVCERLLPNYEAFSRLEQWGEPTILRSALDEVWRSLEATSLTPERLHDLQAQCEAVLPDTEDFTSLYTSAALDAGVAILETLACCRDGDPQRAATVASLARDTVDMYVQQKDHLDYADPEFEQKIAAHPLMIRELRKQREDLEELRTATALDREFLEKIRHSSNNQGRSNIDVN